MSLCAADWLQVLRKVGVRPATADTWAPAFADEWGFDRFSMGEADVVALLAQVLHETALLGTLEENLNYSTQRLMAVWPRRFPDTLAAARCAYNPQALAEAVYGGRMGNVPGSGDAWRFRGRGPLQFTGRATYELLLDLMGQDTDVVPEIVQQPHYGLQAARLWWEHQMPDGCLSDTARVRRRINGGTIGLEHCQQLADECRRAFA